MTRHARISARWARPSASSCEAAGKKAIPYIRGHRAGLAGGAEIFCASLATYGGVAMFHMPGHHARSRPGDGPRRNRSPSPRPTWKPPAPRLTDASDRGGGFRQPGLPAPLARARSPAWPSCCKGRQVRKEFWITTSRPIKQIADRMGYTQVIEASGAKFAVDTCCVVAPIKGRFTRPGDRQRQGLLLCRMPRTDSRRSSSPSTRWSS